MFSQFVVARASVNPASDVVGRFVTCTGPSPALQARPVAATSDEIEFTRPYMAAPVITRLMQLVARSLAPALPRSPTHGTQFPDGMRATVVTRTFKDHRHGRYQPSYPLLSSCLSFDTRHSHRHLPQKTLFTKKQVPRK